MFDERALEIDTFLQCLLLPSTNRVELAPGSTTLTTLNGSPLVGTTPIASIASWQTEFTPRTDGVVTYESQSLLSVYPQLANTVVFQLDNPFTLGIPQILHLLVNQSPSTAALVHTVVSAVDQIQGSAPPPPQAGVPGAPLLAMTTAGGQTVSTGRQRQVAARQPATCCAGRSSRSARSRFRRRRCRSISLSAPRRASSRRHCCAARSRCGSWR